MADEPATRPEVSVVIVTFNHGRFIADALDGVLMQKTDFAFEIIVSDDASTDDTVKIVRSYQEIYPQLLTQVMVSRSNINDNSVTSRTWRAVRGKYVAVMDGDDYWTAEDKLQRQYEFLEQNRTYSACFHNAWNLWEDQSKKSHLHNGPGQRPVLGERDIWTSNNIATCTILYRKVAIGPLPPWYDKIEIGDWPMHILSAAWGPIAYLPSVMAVYRRHAAGLWTSRTTINEYETIIGFLGNMAKVLGSAYEKLAQAGKVHYGLRLASAYAAQFKTGRAGASLLQAFVRGAGNKYIDHRWLLNEFCRMGLRTIRIAMRGMLRDR